MDDEAPAVRRRGEGLAGGVEQGLGQGGEGGARVGVEAPGGLGAGEGPGQAGDGPEAGGDRLHRGRVLLHQLVVTPLQAGLYIRQVGHILLFYRPSPAAGLV